MSSPAPSSSARRTPYLRGEIYFADLKGAEGSEQAGMRPVVIIQNNTGNRYAPTVIVVPCTTATDRTALPTHVFLDGKRYGLPDQIIMAEQIRTLDKRRLRRRVAVLTPEDTERLNRALRISIGMDP